MREWTTACSLTSGRRGSYPRPSQRGGVQEFQQGGQHTFQQRFQGRGVDDRPERPPTRVRLR